MSRIPLVEPEAAPALVQRTYKELESWGMSLLNVMKLFANHAEFFAGFVGLSAGLATQLLPLLNPDPRDARSERWINERRNGLHGGTRNMRVF
jgi:hypothetical protein